MGTRTKGEIIAGWIFTVLDFWSFGLFSLD